MTDIPNSRAESGRGFIRSLESAPAYRGGASFDGIGREFYDLVGTREVVRADVLDAWLPPSPKAMAATFALRDSACCAERCAETSAVRIAVMDAGSKRSMTDILKRALSEG